MPKNKDFGFQRSPRPKQPDQGTPDQPANIAHRGTIHRFASVSQLFWFCGRDSWKSRPHGGRPRTPADIRQLIREMSVANPLWGAPRIHGELLKLGIELGQTTVAKYMAKRRRPPSQGWKRFLRNHADAIASMDLFVVPTISFRLLYGVAILLHSRRELLWLGVTSCPDAEWIARQLTEACGWRKVPRYLVRDRDGAYGEIFLRRLRAMGIRDRPIAAQSPWQNGYAERLIGSIRRECLDHVVVSENGTFGIC
jgi:transposase InsO family protein